MTAEAQRIAIAEACGWKRVCGEEYVDLRFKHRGEGKYFIIEQQVPDYLDDLNACHEMEKDLNAFSLGWQGYINQLDAIRRKQNEDWSRPGWSLECFLLHATAAQRAEAFLRTVGKWEETVDNKPSDRYSK